MEADKGMDGCAIVPHRSTQTKEIDIIGVMSNSCEIMSQRHANQVNLTHDNQLQQLRPLLLVTLAGTVVLAHFAYVNLIFGVSQMVMI